MLRLLLITLLLSWSSAGAARGQEAPITPHAGEDAPVEGRAFRLLLERGDELGLSEGQASRLRAIGRELESVNRPLRERLAAERRRFVAERRTQLERMTPEQRRAELARMRGQGRPPLPPSMQPVAAEMLGNIRSAMRQAQAVLTPAQRRRAHRMLREAREERSRNGPARRRWRDRHAAPRS